MSEIEQYYGGSLLAMKGKDSVAIVSDKRLGNGAITDSKEFEKIFRISNKIYVGFTGLYSDAQMLVKHLKTIYDLKKIEKDRELEPKEISEIISYLLYSKRLSPYYLSVVVAGISSTGEPFISGMDCIGCQDSSNKFITSGTSSNNLAGICEAIYMDEMEENDLFVASIQAFLNSVDRDALSGWGADCFIINKDCVVKRKVQGRCD